METAKIPGGRWWCSEKKQKRALSTIIVCMILCYHSIRQNISMIIWLWSSTYFIWQYFISYQGYLVYRIGSDLPRLCLSDKMARKQDQKDVRVECWNIYHAYSRLPLNQYKSEFLLQYQFSKAYAFMCWDCSEVIPSIPRIWQPYPSLALASKHHTTAVVQYVAPFQMTCCNAACTANTARTTNQFQLRHDVIFCEFSSSRAWISLL